MQPVRVINNPFDFNTAGYHVFELYKNRLNTLPYECTNSDIGNIINEIGSFLLSANVSTYRENFPFQKEGFIIHISNYQKDKNDKKIRIRISGKEAETCVIAADKVRVYKNHTLSLSRLYRINRFMLNATGRFDSLDKYRPAEFIRDSFAYITLELTLVLLAVAEFLEIDESLLRSRIDKYLVSLNEEQTQPTSIPVEDTPKIIEEVVDQEPLKAEVEFEEEGLLCDLVAALGSHDTDLRFKVSEVVKNLLTGSYYRGETKCQ